MHILSEITKASKKIVKVTMKNLPSILTYFGCAGAIGTAVSTALATPKAIDVYHSYHSLDKDGETSVRTVLQVGKCYIWPMIIGGATIFCVLEANHINLTRIKQWEIAYGHLAKSFMDYKAELGESASAIAGCIAGKSAPTKEMEKDEDPKDDREHWFYLDCPQVERKWFKSTWNHVMTAAAKANDAFAYTGWCPLNKYLDELGYSPEEISHIPDELGWDVSYLFEQYEVPFIPFEYGEIDLGNGLIGNGIYFPIEASVCYDYIY